MRFLKLLVMVLLVAAAVAAFYVLVPFAPAGERFVEIAPGTGTPGIARQLQQAGVVRSAFAFEALRAVYRAGGQAGTLKAGEYRFAEAASLREVYDRLRRGDVSTVTVVVKEGHNIFDIADAVSAAGLVPREEFLEAEREHVELIAPWVQAQGAHVVLRPDSLEGFLFPDTYKFSHKATPVQMLAVMVKRFTQVATKLGVSPGDAERVVTMASLVEKEVHLDAERPVVAGVFENRLAAGMPLQTDPAVVYASLLRGTWKGVIHQSELHSDSPYNTYVHTGLPPGPICNPGLAAMKAALRPAQTEYLYFVAGPDGSTRFAKTLAEHGGNVEMYRAGR